VSEQHLAAFVDLLPEGAAFVAADGIVLAANEAMTARLGVTPEELIGRDLAERVGDPGELRESIVRCVERRQKTIRLAPARGESEPLVVHAAVYESQGAGALLFLRQATGASEARPAPQPRSDFVTTISHELRSPLNAIVTWAHVLRQGGLDAAISLRALEAIERNAHLQARLLDDLVGLARAGGEAVLRPLPAAAEEADEEVVITPDQSAKRPPLGNGGFSDLSGVRVLVVDDDRDTRDSITTLLIENRADACNAGSVREALRSLAERPPHVVVTDLLMPDLDGFSLLRMIRTIEELNAIRIPTIALTALSSEESQRRGLESGFDVYLMKPIKPDELLSIVAAAAQSQASAHS
jgi:PAS domain S-box-containing protein